MPKPSRYALIVLTGCCAAMSVGCRSDLLSQFGRVNADVADSTAASPLPANSATPTTQPVSSTVITSVAQSSGGFQQAIERASNAFTLSRSAQSQDDWKLVARRWQQAIDLMAAVPNTDPNHAQAQKKVPEYRSNLAYAQQQAARSTADPRANGTVVIRTPPSPSPTPRSNANRPPSPSRSTAGNPNPGRSTAPTTTATRPAPPQPAATRPQSGGRQVFYAPIVRREGNTPVIRVMFNGSQPFDMIVDTGASGTLITQSMAQALGVVPVAATRVDTASEQGVIVPLGYVNSIEVDGAVASRVLVAIAGPELSTGLLGHDFFGHYDVTIRENEVQFQER